MVFFFIILNFVFSETIKYCIYSKNENLCLNDTYGIHLSEKKIHTNLTRPDQFFGVDLYIYLVENISTYIDLIPIKEANIHIIGVGEKKSFGLEILKIATLNFVELNNVEAVKDETTSFFILEINLKNVTFVGYDKASCFYSTILRTDLNSVSDTTFKSDLVLIDVSWDTKFHPNYKVDGAIFTDEVIFHNFLNNSSIFQYGDQFIITPIKEEFGFRRTNFRPIEGKIKYTIDHNKINNILNIGSWFSNRISSFSEIYINSTNNIINLLGYKWRGHEKLYLTSFNSTININDKKPILSFLQIENSIIKFNAICIIDTIDMNKFLNSKIIGSSISINTLKMTHNSIFNTNMNFVYINNILGTQNPTNCSLIGSLFILKNIASSISYLNVESIKFTNIINMEFDLNYPHVIISNNISEFTTIQFNLISNNPLLFNSNFYPLLISNSLSTIKNNIERWINFEIFPFYGEFLDNSFGINGSNIDFTKSFNICFSNNINDKCGFLHATTYTSILPLSQILINTNFPKQNLITKKVSINISLSNVIFEIDTNSTMILNTLNIYSNFNSFILFKKFEGFFNISLFNSFINTTLNSSISPIFHTIKFNNCNFDNSFLNYFLFNNITTSEFDQITYSHLINIPTPKNLILYTKVLTIYKDYFNPILPINQNKTSITLVDVESIYSPGKHIYPTTFLIYPSNNINFTTNSWGKMWFKMRSNLQTVKVFYKAILPVDFDDDSEYLVIPNYLGTEISSQGKFCAGKIQIPLADKEIINIGDSTLYCPNDNIIDIPTEVQMISPYIKGFVKMNKITILRQIYLEKDTLFDVTEFSNPDDDFLLYFNWTLDQMPFMKISRFIDTHSTSFNPSIQVYIYPSDEDDYIANHSVFQMGIPFLCIYSNDYKGFVFHDGLLFRLNNKSVKTSTVFNKIAQEKEGDICSYLVPYKEQIIEPPKVGPLNPKPWIITLISSIIFLILLTVFLIYQFLKEVPKEEKSVISSTLI